MRNILAAVVALLAAAPARAEETALPGWLAGCWEQVEGERWTEECWSAPRAGILIGAGRSGEGERLHGWEAMQIIRGADGRVTFWASPGGAPRVAFAMTAQSAREIVFTNPRHDYPQRVRYWREGEVLRAEVAMADGSNAEAFRFAPAGSGPVTSRRRARRGR